MEGCVTVKGLNHVLCAAWNLGDNSGPQNSTKVTAATLHGKVMHLIADVLADLPPQDCHCG